MLVCVSLSVRELFVFRSLMPASADATYAWHAQPDALTRLTPPRESARVVEHTGRIDQPGARVKIELRIGPLAQAWTAEPTGSQAGRGDDLRAIWALGASPPVYNQKGKTRVGSKTG